MVRTTAAGAARRARNWAIAQVRAPRQRGAGDYCIQRWCLQPNRVAASDLAVPAARARRVRPARRLRTRSRNLRVSGSVGGVEPCEPCIREDALLRRLPWSRNGHELVSAFMSLKRGAATVRATSAEAPRMRQPARWPVALPLRWSRPLADGPRVVGRASEGDRGAALPLDLTKRNSWPATQRCYSPSPRAALDPRRPRAPNRPALRGRAGSSLLNRRKRVTIQPAPTRYPAAPNHLPGRCRSPAPGVRHRETARQDLKPSRQRSNRDRPRLRARQAHRSTSPPWCATTDGG
jgi:hypothetical protein